MAEPRRVLITVAILAAVLPACASQSGGKKKPIVKDCILPQDQRGTLSGRWRVQPVPVAFKQGDLDSVDTADIVKAAQTWNEFYGASLGIKVLDFGDAGNPNLSQAGKPSSVCLSGILTGNTFTGQVVIYRQTRWPYANHDAIALTTFCPSPANPIPNIYMAIMEINFEDFFTEGRKQPDMQSIFTHEFGHLVGLDHSCNMTAKPGFPTCNASLPEGYLSSVLFPQILFDTSGAGEKRRDLTDNDMGRANCLYKDLVGAK
jgi:hypothetical protein